ncbi:MAG: gliding motility-associated protein GldE [Bacteroidales bacterium]|nr:gliding motility-associated protein GldE [Bacteroidales bacterium]
MGLLLYLSALISGSEVAFFSLTPEHLNSLRSNSTRLNQRVLELLATPKKLLATILIANNFINVSIIILSTFISTRLFSFDASPILIFILQVLVVSVLILLLGEILPKMFAANFALVYATRISGLLKSLGIIFHPLSSLLVNSTSFIDKHIKRKGHEVSLSELGAAIDITADNNTAQEERNILKGIVKFSDIEVKEIMRSRIDVTAVEINTSFAELHSVILNSGYSRIPVYEDSFDMVQGILYIKDLLPYLDKPTTITWPDLLRPAFFVPENKRINDLLQEFRSKKIHMAIVVDEYGGTSGIITLEDIIEEIIGEINDEFDVEAEDITYSKIDARNFIFEGKTLLNDFCKIIGIEDKIFSRVKGESDTLAGLLLELMGKIPLKDETVEYDNFVFKVEAVDKRRIKRIQVTIKNLHKL